MDRQLLQGHQRTLEKLTQRFITKDININKFYGYDSDDIYEWLDEFDYQLEAREISPDSKTALTQLTIHIAGPAQEYIRALAPEKRATALAVKEALRSCYSSRNREWVKRQAVTQRRHKVGEPLEDYVSDMVSKLNKLEMLETSRIYGHFIEGLQPEFQKEILKAKPKTLSEAVEAAKDFDALSMRTSQHRESDPLSKILEAITANQ